MNILKIYRPHFDVYILYIYSVIIEDIRNFQSIWLIYIDANACVARYNTIIFTIYIYMKQ